MIVTAQRLYAIPQNVNMAKNCMVVNVRALVLVWIATLKYQQRALCGEKGVHVNKFHVPYVQQVNMP